MLISVLSVKGEGICTIHSEFPEVVSCVVYKQGSVYSYKLFKWGKMKLINIHTRVKNISVGLAPMVWWVMWAILKLLPQTCACCPICTSPKKSLYSAHFLHLDTHVGVIFFVLSRICTVIYNFCYPKLLMNWKILNSCEEKCSTVPSMALLLIEAFLTHISVYTDSIMVWVTRK